MFGIKDGLKVGFKDIFLVFNWNIVLVCECNGRVIN